MTKFWMMVVTILALGFTTGCPDGDDCASDPSLCDSDTDTDAGADADSDADPDATETGADADTTEDTACPTCPDVTGNWALTYRNSESGAEGHYALTLEQTGSLVTGYDDLCEYSGTISESGYISLFRDCASIDRTVTGNFQAPPHMEGSWDDSDALAHGTWLADPQ